MDGVAPVFLIVPGFIHTPPYPSNGRGFAKKLTKQQHIIKRSSLAIAIVFFLAFPAAARSGADPKQSAEILNAAESVFESMAKRDFPALWRGLTGDTRRTIVRNVYKAVGKAGINFSEEEIRADFEKGGGIAQDYWGVPFAVRPEDCPE
jgi:hypothetical protein